jgi:putative drug exporter of the RND superfamily
VTGGAGGDPTRPASLESRVLIDNSVRCGTGFRIDGYPSRAVLRRPSSMRLLGDWNWWLPRWLDWLPRVTVEGESDELEVAGAGASA